jgi:hypothetical protein
MGSSCSGCSCNDEEKAEMQISRMHNEVTQDKHYHYNPNHQVNIDSI